MNIVLWSVAALLALAFLLTGAMKTLRSKEKIAEANGDWALDFSPAALKAIGLAEVLGALGLVLPPLANTATVLVPVAAIGLALVMAGAVVLHVRRGEGKEAVPSVVLLLLSLLVAWGRLGPYAF